MLEKQWFVPSIGFVVVVLVVVGLWYNRSQAPVPTVKDQEPILAVSTTPTVVPTELKASITPTSAPAVSKFPINPADSIASWSFKGVYTGNDALIAKANADMTHLRSLIGKGEYDDYDLYIGIGNAYGLMGDGASAYQNYNRAVSARPNKGLAYANLAHLMDELGAYHTAVNAYAKAVAVEPISQYILAQSDYLKWRFPKRVVQ